MSAPDTLDLNKDGQPFALLPQAATLKPTKLGKARLGRGIVTAAILLLAVPLITEAADAGGSGGGGRGGGFGGHSAVGGMGFGGRGGGLGFAPRPIGGARGGGIGIGGRSLRAGQFTGPSSTASRAGVSRGVFGNRTIANAALQPRFGFARFHGRFFGSPWPWWWGGLAIGWIGPVFWPYVYYDFFDYVFWPYAYDDFWPYAYDDIYYGIYGPYAYGGYSNGSYAGRSAQRGASAARYAARTNGSERRAAEVCSDDAAQLTNLPI